MPPQTERREYIILVATLVVGLALVSGCRRRPATPADFAVPVTAAEVLVQTTTNYLEFIGQTLGGQDVEIRARVPGFLESVNFKEGTVVKSNALLYTIGDRSFRVALSQAKGRLAEVEAAWLKAQQDTNRFGPLWERHAISRQQLDDSIAAERAAAASMKTARAIVDAALLELDRTRIYAPIEGLAGKTEVKPGNLVGQGAATLLTTLSSLDPIHVSFSVNEKVFLDWSRNYEQGSKAAKGVFELTLADGTIHPEGGNVAFADRQVDPATGTLLLEVSFPNPQGFVRPGQFARVRFPVEVIPNAILVPQRCVQEFQATYSVFVVGADDKAQLRKITIGPRVDTFYVVDEGLKPGEKVVVGGIQKLQTGVPMSVALTNLASEFIATKPAPQP